jgi:branched-chain amino acid transport system substrate-binding protein
MTVQNPYVDDVSPAVAFWAKKYKTKFGEDPTVFSVYGYNAIDGFIRAAEKAGPNLTTDALIKALETMSLPPDMFGSAPVSFGPQKRQGSNESRLSQLQDGRWKVITDYVKPM